MTEQEKLMCEIMGNISQTKAPIVFKGALITKLILAEHGFETIERQTTDIDSNWIGDSPPMSVLVETISQSLGNLQDSFHAVAIREYVEKKISGS